MNEQSLAYKKVCDSFFTKDKRTIKVNFCDFSAGTQIQYSVFSPLLLKYNLEVCDEPDFLFFSGYGMENLKYKNCVKVYFSDENFVPDFNICDYGIGFHYINFGERYFQRLPLYEYIKDIQEIRKQVTSQLCKRKFCNFVYSNDNIGEGAILRKEFFKKLSEYKFVDAPASVCHNIDIENFASRFDANAYLSKINLLSQYKFTIAFENSTGEGYTTEKFSQPFLANSVPIYWGNPRIGEEINPKTFINCNDFDNDLDKVIERVIELDNNDEMYLEILSENVIKNEAIYNRVNDLTDFLVNIIEKGNKPFGRCPYLNYQV